VPPPACAGRARIDPNHDGESRSAAPARRGVAAAYAFLVSDEASFISGKLLVIDGGQLPL